MSGLEFLSVIIPSLSWPIATMFIAWCFASEIPKILPRLHKVGPSGLELFPNAADQKRADGGSNTDLSTVELDPLTDPVAQELETRLLVEVANLPPEHREKTLVRALTNSQMARSFALAYSNIFGSQISALEKLNASSVSRDEAARMFEELKARDPIFVDLTLEQYLQFLFDWKFISQQNGQLFITQTGRNFLQFMVSSGLSKDRLH